MIASVLSLATVKRKQTPARQSLDPGQRSVVGSQLSRIRKDAMRYAVRFLFRRLPHAVHEGIDLEGNARSFIAIDAVGLSQSEHLVGQ